VRAQRWHLLLLKYEAFWLAGIRDHLRNPAQLLPMETVTQQRLSPGYLEAVLRRATLRLFPRHSHIHDYIVQDSKLYARCVSEALIKKNIELDELPRKGRKVPELNADAERELSLYSYRICM
jgi:hypothetical protein